MTRSNLRRTWVGFLLLIAVPTCFLHCGKSEPPPPAKLSVPEIFKTQLMSFLEKGAKVNALAAQGITYAEMRQQVADARASYDLVVSTWPPDFTPRSRYSIEQAFEGWSLVLNLWKLKIDNGGEPVEPYVNHYSQFLSYGGARLVLKLRPHIPYDEHYLPFDENISVLLAIAGEHFDMGKMEVLLALPSERQQQALQDYAELRRVGLWVLCGIAAVIFAVLVRAYHIRCPYCKKLVHRDAVACQHCRGDLKAARENAARENATRENAAREKVKCDAAKNIEWEKARATADLRRQAKRRAARAKAYVAIRAWFARHWRKLALSLAVLVVVGTIAAFLIVFLPYLL